MVCSGCGAHLIDGTEKCPFCKEILSGAKGTVSDVTYKIDSQKQVDLIKKSTQSGISLEKRRERRRRKRKQRIIGYAILLAIAALLIAIIVGVISLFIHIFSDNTKYTTAFYADNAIGLHYDGEVVSLTKEAIDTASLGEETDYAIENDEIIKKSKDGKVTCFIEKYDVKKKQGTLKLIIEDDYEDIITVSDKTSGGFLISDDGEHILFIKNANAKGNRGELWYSNKGKKSVKIAEKVDIDKIVFSNDFEKVLYLKNYNYKSNCGDAYMADFDDFSETKIDAEVYAIYGTSKNGDVSLYSKSYNSDSKTFDLYLNDGKEATRAVMGCGNAPVLSETGKFAFVCGDRSEDRYNLYRIDLKKLKTDKIISNMSRIERISQDGEKVFYSKLFDNNVGDYYIWTEGETELKVADGVNYTKENQVAVSKDFEKVAYIANYNEDKKGGLLYYCEYNEDSVSVAEKISDDVYDCYVLNNDKIVYNKNYNTKGKTAQLYVYNGVETQINREINPRFLKVQNEQIICIYDYSAESGGNLYVIDADMSETKLTTDAFGFFIKQNGNLLIMRNKDSKTSKFDLYEAVDFNEVVLLKKDAKEILFY